MQHIIRGGCGERGGGAGWCKPIRTTAARREPTQGKTTANEAHTHTHTSGTLCGCTAPVATSSVCGIMGLAYLSGCARLASGISKQWIFTRDRRTNKTHTLFAAVYCVFLRASTHIALFSVRWPTSRRRPKTSKTEHTWDGTAAHRWRLFAAGRAIRFSLARKTFAFNTRLKTTSTSAWTRVSVVFALRCARRARP